MGSEKLDRLRELRKTWQEKNVGLKERQEKFFTDSGIAVDVVYTPLETEWLDYARDLGLPGEYPYTRGVQPNMYRGRLWTMRQYAGYGDARETNRRFKYLLEQGQTGLSVAFDLPTQIGYDSDSPYARGEVGKVGVAIDTLADMETLFEGIPLDKVSTSMTINAPCAVILAMYLAVAEKQGVSWEKLEGTVQNDILKEYVARGTYIFPPAPSMRLVTDVMAFCAEKVPRWNTISISGYHIREAGATAVQELAFTLANGIAYVEAAINAGLEVDTFAPRLSFFFNAHLNFFEEIAKFRAARRLWARIMRERFGARNPRSWMLRFHTQTAGCTLTAQQPLVNLIRVAYQALSAVLGGTQSLHTNSFDEALALPSEEAARLALRTQQVLAYETGVADTVDPLGGSYFVEALTSEIERKAEEYLAEIDRLGGAVKAIEAGYFQREIQESAYRYQKAVESGAKTVVGVNRFQISEASAVNVLRVRPEVEAEQIARLNEVRAKRNAVRVKESLAEVERAARSGDNLMPALIEAVKSYATIGEICDVLRHVFGVYQQYKAIV